MISKNGEDSAALKAEYNTFQNTNEQLTNQLSTKTKDCQEKEAKALEWEAEHKQVDKALLAAIGNATKLKTELREAELEVEDIEEDWRKWHSELDEGIDASRSSAMLWKHLCDKMSKPHSASQAPGSAITDEEMAETRRIKSRLNEMESECAELKTEVKKEARRVSRAT